MPKPLQPCGTNAAYLRHWRNSEPVDDACQQAHAAAGRHGSRVRQNALEALAREHGPRFLELLDQYRQAEVPRG